jgi:hypothetical protein
MYGTLRNNIKVCEHFYIDVSYCEQGPLVVNMFIHPNDPLSTHTYTEKHEHIKGNPTSIRPYPEIYVVKHRWHIFSDSLGYVFLKHVCTPCNPRIHNRN